MSVVATPTLAVADVAVAGSLAGAPSLVAVDGLRVPWGRSSVLETAQPATATLTVLDRTPGGTFAGRTDLIGQPLTLGWSIPGAAGTTFAGRITDVGVTRTIVRNPVTGATGRAYRVALAASSLEVDLANYTQPEGTTFPAETLGARRARLAALIPPGIAAGGLTVPDRFSLGLQYVTGPDSDLDTLPVAAVDVSGKSLLDLVRQLYASYSPLPAVYDPAGRFTYAGRRQFAYSPIGMTISARAVADPDHGGLYVPASLSGLHLDGGLIESDGGSLTQQLDSRITRVEVSYRTTAVPAGWFTDDLGYCQMTAAAATVNTGSEAALGRRVLTVDSILATEAAATQLANLYADLASVEARTPRLSAVGWSSAREPLHDAAHAALLLSGSESGATVFLGRSWLPELGQSPLVGNLGGTISYAGGEWSVELTPAPITINPSPFGWAPITPTACAPTVRARDLHPSLTFGDARHLDVGIGYDASTVVSYKGNPL